MLRYYFSYSSCSCLCHIYSWFLLRSWVSDLSISLSICREYIYVWLDMPSYLFFCIYFNAWYITCCPKREEALEIYIDRVKGEVLVLGLLVVVCKIPYSSCMWARPDVIGVFPSYYCLPASGTTCVPVIYPVQRVCLIIVQYITTSLLLLSTWYTVEV